MVPKAQTKSVEIHEKLWAYINTKTIAGQDVIDSVEKEIASFKDGTEKSYLTALIYAAKGDFDSAVKWFNEALSSGDSTIALNYLAYIGSHAHNYFHRLEIFRLEKIVCVPTIRRIARNAAYCIGNTKLIRSYSLKLSALCGDEEKQELRDQGERMISVVDEFKQATTLSSSQIEELCDEAEDIANKYGVNCIGAHYFVSGESDNAYIIRAETDDSELLAELNIELLCLLASEKYRKLPFTSWFTSDVDQMEIRNVS